MLIHQILLKDLIQLVELLLNSDAVELNNGKSKNVPSDLRSLKSKVDKLDADKLKTVRTN